MGMKLVMTSRFEVEIFCMAGFNDNTIIQGSE